MNRYDSAIAGGAILILRAASFAAKAHASQRRKGLAGIPYVNHVIEVAALVAETGGTDEEVAAALLHDVVEDSEVAIAEISDRFGAVVATLVSGLTDDPAWHGLPRTERKAAQAARLKDKPAAVRRIKIADQTANLRDIARDPHAWASGDALEYINCAKNVVEACRGLSVALEVEFDNALSAAMQKLEGFQ